MDNKNNNNKNNTQGVCLEDGDREGRIVEDVMVPKHIIDEAVSYTRQEIAKVLDKEQARFENIRDMVMQQEDHVRRLESERARVCSSTIILGAEKHASMIQTLCDGVANSDACLRMLDDSLHKVQCDRSNRLKKIRDLEGDAVGVQKHVKRLVQHNHVTRDLLEDERILLNRYQHDIRDTQERIYTSMQKSMSQQMTLDRVMWRREREREHAAHVQHAVLELQKTLESQSSRWMGQKTSLAQIEKYHHNVSRETHEMQWYIQQVLGTLMQACHGQQHHASQNKLEYPSTILEYIMHGIEDALQKEQCVYREICDSYHAACDRMHGHMQERSNITTRIRKIPAQQISIDQTCHATTRDILKMTSIHLPREQPDIPPCVHISTTLLEEDIHRLERELEQELLARRPQVTEKKDTRHAPGKRHSPQVTLLTLPEEACSENTRRLTADTKTELLKRHLAKSLQSHQPA